MDNRCEICAKALKIMKEDLTFDSNGRQAFSMVDGFQRGCLVLPEMNTKNWTVVKGKSTECMYPDRFVPGTPISGALPQNDHREAVIQNARG